MLDERSRQFINRWQGGVPLVQRPYGEMAGQLGCSEQALLQTIEGLLDEGWITRFGPFYDAAAMGGGLTLAALAVPEDRFEAVARQVNAHAEVAHNYRRDHRLNMWFVVATETPGQVADVLRAIEAETGLQVHDCPKQKEFFIGLQLHLKADGGIDTVPLEHASRSGGHPSPMPLDDADRRLIAASQGGLPLRSNPWRALARASGLDEVAVRNRLQAMIDGGVIRRIGAAPNHYRLGLRGNGMTVWDIPDEAIGQAGELLGGLDFVSHCYQRPRHLPHWPYNLFAMAHGQDRAAVMDKVERMGEAMEQAFGRVYPHEVLFSSAVLKKTGLRLAA